jgi:hypothetical protein
MNKKLIVTLLWKDIQELEMITEGFMEMSEYPLSIIQLAQQKTEDIQVHIKQLSELIDKDIEAVKEVNKTDNEDEDSELIIKKKDDKSTAIFANNRIEFTSQTRNELHSKVDNTISSILDNKKNIDIKESINIGDRFRFQRELFANGEDMNKTFNYINQLSTFEDVKSFLQSRYGWDAKNETAEDFLQIVRRRFL